MCPKGFYSDGRNCRSFRGCTGDQYIATEGTPSSDRICANLTVCTQTQFEKVPPTLTSDRQCQNLTTCVKRVRFESQRPTLTSDRVCDPVRPPCNPSLGEFQVSPRYGDLLAFTRKRDQPMPGVSFNRPIVSLFSRRLHHHPFSTASVAFAQRAKPIQRAFLARPIPSVPKVSSM